MSRKRYVIWTRGQPSGARVVGWWGRYWFIIFGGRTFCPVNSITLAGLNPMQIAQIWEEALDAAGH